MSRFNRPSVRVRACSLFLLSASAYTPSITPSFNSNSVSLTSSSSPHTHLFTCHFLFMSIISSLHFLFLSTPFFLSHPSFSSTPSLMSVRIFFMFIRYFTVYSAAVPSSPSCFLSVSFFHFYLKPTLISSSCWSSDRPPFLPPLSLHPTHHSSSPTCTILSSSPSIFILAMSERPESVSLHYRPPRLQLRNTLENQHHGCHLVSLVLLHAYEHVFSSISFSR